MADDGMAYEGTQALVDEAAGWAAGNNELHMRVRPLAEYFTERYLEEGGDPDIPNAMFTTIMVQMAKALEAGIYVGKFGFPEDRIPEAFKKAFEGEDGGNDEHRP